MISHSLYKVFLYWQMISHSFLFAYKRFFFRFSPPAAFFLAKRYLILYRPRFFDFWDFWDDISLITMRIFCSQMISHSLYEVFFSFFSFFSFFRLWIGGFFRIKLVPKWYLVLHRRRGSTVNNISSILRNFFFYSNDISFLFRIFCSFCKWYLIHL